jgi:hypothetical protein
MLSGRQRQRSRSFSDSSLDAQASLSHSGSHPIARDTGVYYSSDLQFLYREGYNLRPSKRHALSIVNDDITGTPCSDFRSDYNSINPLSCGNDGEIANSKEQPGEKRKFFPSVSAIIILISKTKF